MIILLMDVLLTCFYSYLHHSLITLYIFLHLEAAAIVRMIAVSVAHLHAMNIAHRDLKVFCKVLLRILGPGVLFIIKEVSHLLS